MEIELSQLKLALSFDDGKAKEKIKDIINQLNLLNETVKKLQLDKSLNINTNLKGTISKIKELGKTVNKTLKDKVVKIQYEEVDPNANKEKQSELVKKQYQENSETLKNDLANKQQTNNPNVTDGTTENISSFIKGLIKAQDATSKVKNGLKGVNNQLIKISKTTQIIGKKTFLQKTLGMLGRLSIYRFFSTYYTKTLNAFTEGMREVAKYNDAVNDSLSKTLALKKQLVNSIGSAFSEVYVIIAPLLQKFTSFLIDASNGFARFFARLQGKDTFLKAKKQLADFRKEQEKLKSNTLSIDNLNIVGQDKTENPFEEVKVSDDAVDKLNEIKGTLAIVTALTTLWGIKSGIALKPLLKISGIVAVITLLISRYADFLSKNEEARETFEKLGEIVGEVGGQLSKIFNFVFENIIELVDGLMPAIHASIAQTIPVLKLLGNTFIQITNALTPLISNVFKLLVPIVSIFTRLQLFLHGGIARALISVFEALLTPINLLASALENVLKWLQPIFDIVFTIVDWANKGLGWVLGLFGINTTSNNNKASETVTSEHNKTATATSATRTTNDDIKKMLTDVVSTKEEEKETNVNLQVLLDGDEISGKIKKKEATTDLRLYGGIGVNDY